jgi:hypothetical protein
VKITTNKQAAFMADAQIPWGLEALNGTISQPAWKGKPSGYLVVSEDKMIPPDAQLAMSKRAGATVVEAKCSHATWPQQQSRRPCKQKSNLEVLWLDHRFFMPGSGELPARISMKLQDRFQFFFVLNPAPIVGEPR